ncbi:MAG: ferrous iron transport protein B, partial [Planctomycetes bacterium]|nr:ferrous iron transport protein B [Planctomycetota bacterium]
EMLAVDVILGNNPDEPRPDVVVTIVDASNLERNLYLMTQVLELGVPVVIALNMMDVAEGQGLTIHVDKLSQQLCVPIVPIQANAGKGLDQLKAAIATALSKTCCVHGPTFPDVFEAEVTRLRMLAGFDEPAFLIRRLLLDVGGQTETRLVEKYGPTFAAELKASRDRLIAAGFTLAGIEARVRYAWIRKAIAGCIDRPAVRPIAWTDHLDKVLMHKIFGTLIFLAVMFIVFESIFLIADPIKSLIDLGKNSLAGWIRGSLGPGAARSLLVEGVINGVGSVIVFVPQIMLLFAIIAVLEDCGYMARAAFLMDRLMSRAGLNGKSFIPLLSSMACAVPGIMSARVIENPRDRLATILVAPLMSCSARLPVYSLLIGAFFSSDAYPIWLPGLVFFGLYMLGIILAPLVAMVLKSTLLHGETPAFVMEMPLYKMPSAYTVAHRALDACWMFLKRAGTMILATMILVWAALYFPSGDFPARIDELEQAIAPQRERIDALKADDAKKTAAIKDLEDEMEPTETKIKELSREWKSQSALGVIGRWIEPAVMPLGWDWRIGMAAIASFPAREVMVGTLGIAFGEGEGDAGDNRYRNALGETLRRDTAFSVPVALSVLVFFALCCQCISTLVVIKRETNSWLWPTFTFVYMTALAYFGAMLTYQIGSLF